MSVTVEKKPSGRCRGKRASHAALFDNVLGDVLIEAGPTQTGDNNGNLPITFCQCEQLLLWHHVPEFYRSVKASTSQDLTIRAE